MKFKPGDKILCFKITEGAYVQAPVLKKIYTVKYIYENWIFTKEKERGYNNFLKKDFISATETIKILYGEKEVKQEKRENNGT